MNIERRKKAVAWLSVLSNSTLVVLKIIVGLLIGSVSVISEAIHSGVDLLASIIALVAVRTSSKPADEKHPFGHGKIENVSGVIEALLIFVAAAWIIFEAWKKIVHPQEIDIRPGWGVAVMLVSAASNWIVSGLLFKVGRETDSIALQADGWHLRTDVYTSLGVLAGLTLIQFVDVFFPHLGDSAHLIDPLAAIIVATLIIRAAWKLTVQSAKGLMDEILPKEEEEGIREILKSFVPTVHGFHRMRTRKAGPTRFIEFHIFVDGKMTVEDSHSLAHQICRRIEERYPGASLTVHVEPCIGNCQRNCRFGCLLSPQQRQDVIDERSEKKKNEQ